MLPNLKSISQHDDRGTLTDLSATSCTNIDRRRLVHWLRIKGKLPSGTPGSTVSIVVAGDEESLPLTCEVRWIKAGLPLDHLRRRVPRISPRIAPVAVADDPLRQRVITFAATSRWPPEAIRDRRANPKPQT